MSSSAGLPQRDHLPSPCVFIWCDAVLAGRFDEVDSITILCFRKSREIRDPDIVAIPRALREKYGRVSMIVFYFTPVGSFKFGAGEICQWSWLREGNELGRAGGVGGIVCPWRF